MTDDTEALLLEQLRLLRMDYAKAIQPILDQLIAIRRLRAPDPIIVPLEQANTFGLRLPGEFRLPGDPGDNNG